MLHEQPRDGSSARERAAFASPAMIFTPQGLMLGAGTILVPAEGTRKLKSLKGREQQVLALLSAAYGTAVAPSVLGNIERAAKSWSQGDDVVRPRIDSTRVAFSVERVCLAAAILAVSSLWASSVKEIHIPWTRATLAAEYAVGCRLSRDSFICSSVATPTATLATDERPLPTVLDPDRSLPSMCRARPHISPKRDCNGEGLDGRAQAYLNKPGSSRRQRSLRPARLRRAPIAPCAPAASRPIPTSEQSRH